jgi:hypothetical protein
MPYASGARRKLIQQLTVVAATASTNRQQTACSLASGRFQVRSLLARFGTQKKLAFSVSQNNVQDSAERVVSKAQHYAQFIHTKEVSFRQ